MDDFITRAEHTQEMNRMYDRVNAIHTSSVKIEESSKHIEKLVMSMHVLLYGNGKMGLITKISNLVIKVKHNQWFVRTIFVVIITTAAFVIRSTFTG